MAGVRGRDAHHDGNRAAAAADGRRTLAATYDLHGAAVYGLAHWITGDAEVAAELTSKVFAALRHLDVARGLDGLRACVLSNVHRRAVEWTRRHSPLTARDATLPLEGLDSLDRAEQIVVTEAYFGGKTYDAVAEMLGVDRIEVARLMQSALHRLGSTGSGAVSAQPRTA